jgi:hypothetical protein
VDSTTPPTTAPLASSIIQCEGLSWGSENSPARSDAASTRGGAECGGRARDRGAIAIVINAPIATCSTACGPALVRAGLLLRDAAAKAANPTCRYCHHQSARGTSACWATEGACKTCLWHGRVTCCHMLHRSRYKCGAVWQAWSMKKSLCLLVWGLLRIMLKPQLIAIVHSSIVCA